MFIIYSIPNCSFCEKAKELLKDIPYIEHLSSKENYLSLLSREGFPNFKKAPCIVENGQLIGGYNDLEKYLKK